METRNVTARHFDTGATSTFTIELPDACPRCKRKVHLSTLSTVHDGTTVCSLYRCGGCKSFFISWGPMGHGRQEKSILEPNLYVKQSFDESIEKLSPDFVKIYNESLAAESTSLFTICGVGYRKALEFLVKDFAIKLNPDKEELIKEQLLAKVIRDYIDSKRIKTLAERTAWIGNDETHYERKHEDLNFSDMKRFISSMLFYVTSEMVAIEADSIDKK